MSCSYTCSLLPQPGSLGQEQSQTVGWFIGLRERSRPVESERRSVIGLGFWNECGCEVCFSCGHPGFTCVQSRHQAGAPPTACHASRDLQNSVHETKFACLRPVTPLRHRNRLWNTVGARLVARSRRPFMSMRTGSSTLICGTARKDCRLTRRSRIQRIT